jgi:adenylyl-sulfate kinase
MPIHTHSGLCVWLTGRPASGKSSIATALAAALSPDYVTRVTVLDGDHTRAQLGADLGFLLEDRVEHARRVATLARQYSAQGHLVICALISPTPVARARARELLEPTPFIECHVACPLSICEARDPKGLYARARRQEIAHFTGIDSPYIPPELPDLTVHTHAPDYHATHAASDILAYLVTRGLISQADPSRPQ